MSDSSEPNQPTQTPPPPPANSPGFTQEDINRIAAKEKEEGKRSAERSLLEKLGFGNTEEAKAFIDKVKQSDAEKLTEADRKAKEAEEKNAKAEARDRESLKRLIEVSVKAELLEAGLPKKDVDMVKAMIQQDDLTEDDESKIKDRVKDLKKAMPHLFEQGGPGGPPGSHPAGPGSKNDTRSAEDRAREMLVKRHPQIAKKG